MADLTKEQKLKLITRNLAEALDVDILEKVYDEGREPNIYWGTATTGRPHTGYFVAALKLADFLRAGASVTVLLADIHGFLDNLKAPIEIVQYRAEYYRFTITSMLKAVGVDTSKLRFVLGSEYQKSSDYVMDLFKLSSITSEHDARKAGAEVVKQTSNAPLSGLLYPLLQVLDEQYLGADCQFGGVDQRKLFTAAKAWLPKLGYKERAHLMNPMVPGLQGGKMSSSEADSKIDLLDSPDAVTKKLRKAEAVPKIPENNGVLSFTEFVLLPASELKSGKAEFVVDRSRDNLEPLVYNDIAKMHEDYKNDILTPQILKPAVTKALLELMEPIVKDFESSKEWQEVMLKAYPPEEKAKKVKKVKDKGSRHPGAGPAGAEKAEGKNEKPVEEQTGISTLEIANHPPAP
ncbi:Tyrosine--tRNA ligase like protein [Verticillium longisporum]|uniref:tyrosine--tRNA ligase n=1 Tax=Verticillium longisporum TaxID=100787 RepID=A0A8I2ZGW9_VERLO|nr:Tyrosine--tRNA ligase like protein [Verticillium longisporum]KAG7128472.1 Tyrosine--tRNA ligase like protein [Verticillium longisporum]